MNISNCMKHNVFSISATSAIRDAAAIILSIAIEELLVIGTRVVHIILPENNSSLINALSNSGYGVTSVDRQCAKDADETRLYYCHTEEPDECDQNDALHLPQGLFRHGGIAVSGAGNFPIRASVRQAIFFGRKSK